MSKHSHGRADPSVDISSTGPSTTKASSATQAAPASTSTPAPSSANANACLQQLGTILEAYCHAPRMAGTSSPCLVLSLSTSVSSLRNALSSPVNLPFTGSDKEIMTASMSLLELGALDLVMDDIRHTYWYTPEHLHHTQYVEIRLITDVIPTKLYSTVMPHVCPQPVHF
jgi:hypothetical protein